MQLSASERSLIFVFYVLLTIAGLACLFPLIHIVSLSISDTHAVASGWVSLYPIGFSLESYKQLLLGTPIVNAFLNSIQITGVGVVLSMLFTILAAYPLTRTYFYGRKLYTFAIVFTLLFGGGLIPTYLTVKELGLLNTYWALWLPGLVSTFNLLVLRSFMENIPSELDDAARIDGCGDWMYLSKIVLPLSMPVLTTLALFYGVGYWNSFFSVLIYMNETTKYNLSVLVQQMIQSQTMLAQMNSSDAADQIRLTPEEINSAAIMVMVLPIMVVYPFLQKHFVKGVMIGAVKG
ncbi:carbohydrate ABC transporter permease [Paenibacillus sp. CGMCC 1.16610]|uniref:ABC transporter permease subunit n=1 Tax=Paenibacillus anseongense TaxID=2682845 RepID=A0ABW9UD35_9BACL|nr:MULTISPECIES: carbohydrate ABC transporter permease [Paenibacillus]MBA2937600.1 carbohydrate ABC transporter permease [Paenibacillus sp. CGMCC 1.16610]MVQ36658.1 ABC transporter permease subunit [Paenibacillus anseongense]